MSRFNTGNDIPSLAQEDFYDNCLSLDQAMNSTEPTWRDRFNVEKPTIDAALKSAGFMPAGFDFVTGGTLQPGDRNKAVYNPAPNGDNNWYRWNGVFPKEIAANSQPNPKDENNWVPVDLKNAEHNDLKNRNETDAHRAIAILDENGKDLQKHVDTLDQISAYNNAGNIARANLSVFGTLYQRSNILIIGDSITTGIGTTVPEFSYTALLGQSLANFYPRGYGYPLHRNINNSREFLRHNGQVTNGGISLESITLSEGQAIAISPVNIIAVAGYIIGSMSTQGAVLSLTVDDQPVVNTALDVNNNQQAFFLVIPTGQSTLFHNKVKLVATGGTVTVSGVVPMKEGISHDILNGQETLSPIIMTNGASGESFEFYRQNRSFVAAMSKDFYASGPSVVILALGTNSIYNPVKAQTPDEYVASMIGLGEEIKALDPNITIIYTIPPRAVETTWPVIKEGYAYKDYVKKIKESLPNKDLVDLNIPNLEFNDGVHPNAVGHIELAKHWCKQLGIPFNPELPLVKKTAAINGANPVIIENGIAVKGDDGTVTISGKVLTKGGASTLICTLPPGFRPRKERYVTVPLFGPRGVGVIRIMPGTGEIHFEHGTVSSTILYLDGVVFI
jgi:lysophospholipase L1-like esterase